jgi:hypothetical protein
MAGRFGTEDTYHHEKKRVLASTECLERVGPRRSWMAAMGASKAKHVPITSKETVGGILRYESGYDYFCYWETRVVCGVAIVDSSRRRGLH